MHALEGMRIAWLEAGYCLLGGSGHFAVDSELCSEFSRYMNLALYLFNKHFVAITLVT